METKVLFFPKQTVHKTVALAPGDLLVRLDLKVSAALAVLILELINKASP